MALNIKSAKDFGEIKGTYLIYGPPGMGKTTTIKYLPGKTLLLDVDRTSHVLKGSENIDVIEIDNVHTWDSWTETLTELGKMDLSAYDTIAVDNVSELERCFLADLGRQGKNQGVPAMGDYQYMQFKMVDSLRYLKQLGKRVIWTAWETTDEYVDASGQKWNRTYPQLNGKILNNVLGLCDVVGKMMISKESERGFVLEATNSTYAKNQIDGRKGAKQSELVPLSAENR